MVIVVPAFAHGEQRTTPWMACAGCCARMRGTLLWVSSCGVDGGLGMSVCVCILSPSRCLIDYTFSLPMARTIERAIILWVGVTGIMLRDAA
jgi:hypothetical protein